MRKATTNLNPPEGESVTRLPTFHRHGDEELHRHVLATSPVRSTLANPLQIETHLVV